MAFNPSSTIYLCNVAIDSTNKNQIYFASLSEQQNYFANKVVKTFSNYLTVRKTLADGSLESRIKVNENIDTLQSLNCNYMYYQNANHGTKLFYAFITKMIYINEQTTELVFETDVYQTWLFNVKLKPSYVMREHSETDKIGDNLTPEKFNFNDFVSYKLNITNLGEMGYLVGSSEFMGDMATRGRKISGIYQGIYFYYFHNENHLNEFIEFMEDKHGDCILFITVIPQFNVGNTVWGEVDNQDFTYEDEGFITASTEPITEDIIIDMTAHAFTFENYQPKNNKLFTSPYFKLVVTNHAGAQAEYNIEDFSSTECKFRLYGDISSNPSVTLIPLSYKGLATNYDCGISIAGFPQCSFNSDTFKLWLAKNQFGIGLDLIGNVGQIVTGVASAIGTGGAGTAIGASTAVSGVTGVLSTFSNLYAMSREPNKVQGGGAKNNLLTAMKMNKFDFYVQVLKKEYAQTVDDFFTMFGYQTNKLKVPNVSSRPFFNYVQTVDVNIVGGIPSQDMERLKAIYNNGVTLWKSTATVGDYSVDNSPQ